METLQQINNNLLVYKLMEQEYYNYLIKENDEYLQLYKILLCDNEECKETNSAHIKLY